MRSGLFVDERGKERVQAQVSCLPVALTVINTFAVYNSVPEQGWLTCTFPLTALNSQFQ